MPTLTVKGMSCNHCKQAVTQALEALPGVSDVNVDLEKGEATWYGPASTPTSETPGRAGGSSSPAPGGVSPCPVSRSRKTIPSFSGAKPQGCRPK